MKSQSPYRDGVAVILYDEQMRVLVQARDEHAHLNPNKITFFGGAIESGENPEQAAVREVSEELGIRITKPSLVTEIANFNNTSTTQYLLAVEISSRTLSALSKEQPREGRAALILTKPLDTCETYKKYKHSFAPFIVEAILFFWERFEKKYI